VRSAYISDALNKQHHGKQGIKMCNTLVSLLAVWFTQSCCFMVWLGM
jgi:hypothetical protein